MEPQLVVIHRIDSDADDPVANPARREVGHRLSRSQSRYGARTRDGSDKHLRRRTLTGPREEDARGIRRELRRVGCGIERELRFTAAIQFPEPEVRATVAIHS